MNHLKFKNFEKIEYTLFNKLPPQNLFNKGNKKYQVLGLCYKPGRKKSKILIDPNLNEKKKLNVLIEEVFHAHLYKLPEWKAQKFAKNLGKLIYNQFLKKTK